MLSVLRYRPNDASSLRFGGEELLEGWTRDSEDIIWVDFDGHDLAEEREIMSSRFGINALAIDDAQRDRHPPKLEWFDTYFFLLLKGFTADTDSIDYEVVHISMFVGSNFFVTRHAIPSPSIERVRSRIEGGQFDVSRATKHLCYRVVRTIIDRYAPIVLELEGRLEEMEELMLEQPNDALLAELVTYNSRLKKLRRTFGHQDALLHELLHSIEGLLAPPSQHEFQDAHEQMARMASLTAMLQELTRDLIDGYLSISAHRLNNIMKVLTIASVIFLPLTFIAGIYGMNFANMPELQSNYGYFIVLGVLATVAIMLLAVFRRLRWLRDDRGSTGRDADMSNDEVRRLLMRLRRELEDTELDTETRAALAQLDTDIHRVIGDDEDSDYDVVEQARRLESQFAAEHPTANRVLREIIDTLGKIGI